MRGLDTPEGYRSTQSMTLEIWHLSFSIKVRLDVTLHTDGRRDFMIPDRDRRPHRTCLRT